MSVNDKSNGWWCAPLSKVHTEIIGCRLMDLLLRYFVIVMAMHYVVICMHSKWYTSRTIEGMWLYRIIMANAMWSRSATTTELTQNDIKFGTSVYKFKIPFRFALWTCNAGARTQQTPNEWQHSRYLIPCVLASSYSHSRIAYYYICILLYMAHSRTVGTLHNNRR